MTPSTTSSNEKKSLKKKGPLRLELLVPLSIVVLVIFIYSHFFLNNHLRKLLVHFATDFNGAEVNIGEFNISLFGLSLHMGEVQFTDKTHPASNWFGFRKLAFDISGDALLRLKLVVENAELTGLQLGHKRKKPGFVLPPKPPEVKNSAPSEMELAISKTLKSQAGDSGLSYLGDFLGGSKPEDLLKNVQADLLSDQLVKSLEDEIKEKEAFWDAQIKKLPNDDTLKSLEAEFNKVKDGNVLDKISGTGTLIKKIDEQIKIIDQTVDRVEEDVKWAEKINNRVEDAIDSDLNKVQQLVKMPNLDGEAVGKYFVFTLLGPKIQEYATRFAWLAEYLPPEKPATAATVESTRLKGKTFVYPITTSYPLFWLKRLALSGQDDQNTLKGELTNVSISPPIKNAPAIFRLSGKNTAIPTHPLNLNSQFTIDPRGTFTRIEAVGKIENFPLPTIPLSQEEKFKLHFSDNYAKVNLKGNYQENQLNLSMRGDLQNTNFKVEAKEPKVQEIVTRALGSLGDVYLSLEAGGTLPAITLGANSNLGTAITSRLKDQVGKEIQDLKKKLRQDLKDKVDAKVKPLKEKANNLKNKIKNETEKAKQKLNDLKGKSSKSAKESGKKQTDQLKEQGKKLFKKLF